MSYLTTQEINEIFINANLEGDYNFLQDDLVKLANAYINAAKPKIALEERQECLQVAKSFNSLVAERVEAIRARS